MPGTPRRCAVLFPFHFVDCFCFLPEAVFSLEGRKRIPYFTWRRRGLWFPQKPLIQRQQNLKVYFLKRLYFVFDELFLCKKKNFHAKEMRSYSTHVFETMLKEKMKKTLSRCRRGLIPEKLFKPGMRTPACQVLLELSASLKPGNIHIIAELLRAHSQCVT